MRNLMTILFMQCALGSTAASANEAFEFSFHHNAASKPEHAQFKGANGVQYHHRFGQYVTVMLNVNANSRRDTSPANQAQAVRPNGIGQPLRIGRATVSIGASLQVRFKVKF